jgi:PKD repeat protein
MPAATVARLTQSTVPSMKTAPMMAWPHLSLLGLIVVLSSVCVTSGCRKKEESASASAAQRAASLSVFTPRSHLLVENDAVLPTPTPAVKNVDNEHDEPQAVSVSANAHPTRGGAPLTVSFSAKVSDASPGIQCQWDFGDNSPPSERLDAQHTYASAGQYTATFSVTGRGTSESQAVEIEVTEEGFDVDVNADPDIGTAPLSVEFSALLDTELPQPVSFQWDFGDGSRDVSNPARHTYQQAGQYTATLLVTNGLGQIARRELEIQVDPHAQEDE